MKKYRKLPVVIEAQQWFEVTYDRYPGVRHLQVCYFQQPGFDDEWACDICNKKLHSHGWIETLEGGHRVCPGDWIIKGILGEMYPCKPDIFEKTYELVED